MEVKQKRKSSATRAYLVCAVEGCTDEPDYQMGRGGWKKYTVMVPTKPASSAPSIERSGLSLTVTTTLSGSADQARGKKAG